MELSRKNIVNVAGTGIEKFLKLPIQFISTSMVLREIGVAATGELAMVLATYLIVTSITANGLNQIYIKKEAKIKKYKSSALINYLVTQNIYVLIGVILYIYYIGALSLYTLFILPILFSQLGLLKARAEARRKIISITPLETMAAIIFAVIKIYYLDYITLDLLTIILVAEYSVYNLLPIKFLTKEDFNFYNVNIKIIKMLCRKSLWYVGIALSISIHMRIDQVMLYEMLTLEDNGNYNAIVRVVEAASSLFLIFIPTLNALIQRFSTAYSFEVIHTSLRRGMFVLSGIILILLYFGNELFYLLYGEDFTYYASHAIILFGSLVFMFMGTLTSSIYVKQNLEKYLFFNMIIAAFLNILMNFVFIKAYGVLGACITTFFAYLVTGFLGDFFWRKTFFIGRMKLKALTL